MGLENATLYSHEEPDSVSSAGPGQ
jgi:hypothetical protein